MKKITTDWVFLKFVSRTVFKTEVLFESFDIMLVFIFDFHAAVKVNFVMYE